MTLRNYSSTAAEATLSAGVDASTTTLTVSSTTGFPATPFVLAVDAGAAAQELVLVTNVAGTTLTVTRAFDSTVGAAHSTGAVVAHSHAAIEFREANAHVNASAGVHGVAGSVVGTTDAQALTNKTVALGSNTVSGTRAQFNTAMTDGDFATTAGVETLTNKTLTAPAANGSLASFGGAWTTYTPTLTGFTASTKNGRYVQIGKTVHLVVRCVVTAVSGNMAVALPVAAAGANGYVGTVTAGDDGTANHVGAVALNSTADVVFIPSPSSAGIYGATTPFTWAAGDTIGFSLTYEAA